MNRKFANLISTLKKICASAVKNFKTKMNRRFAESISTIKKSAHLR